jgi:putative transcriptional regulator
MKNLAGNLLIAVPDLEDGNFYRSVVLVLHHDQLGASGVVLNRVTDVTLAEALENSVGGRDAISGEVRQNVKINIGGPVDGPLIVLHEERSLSEDSVIPGVYMSVDGAEVNKIVCQKEGRLRVYSGYSGWAPEQLEAEIDAGGWLVIEANCEHVFFDDSELWSHACKAFAAKVVDLPAVNNIDPELN